MGETANLQFYPSMYTLVTRVLDTFGHLVFTRIFQKAMEDSETASLSLFLDAENFTYHDVNIESKETCHNWFFKIASIRELLPRMYVCRCSPGLGTLDCTHHCCVCGGRGLAL